MKKEVLERLKKVFTGQVDIGERSHQSVINEVFGIGEETTLVPDYDDRTGETVGVREMVSRRFSIAESRGDFDNIGPEAFGRELMGADFYHEVDRALEDPGFFRKIKATLNRPRKIGESVQADTASLYEPINTWGSFVLGLFDHRILAGYDSAPRIFEKLIPTVPTMVHGAQKHTLHDYDGTLPSYDGLAELQEEDTARGAPYWVWSQQIKEFGLQYAISMEALTSDLDGGLGRRGEQFGIAMAKNGAQSGETLPLHSTVNHQPPNVIPVAIRGKARMPLGGQGGSTVNGGELIGPSIDPVTGTSGVATGALKNQVVEIVTTVAQSIGRAMPNPDEIGVASQSPEGTSMALANEVTFEFVSQVFYGGESAGTTTAATSSSGLL